MILIQSGPHTYYVYPIATTILTKHNEEKSKILEKHSEVTFEQQLLQYQ